MNIYTLITHSSITHTPLHRMLAIAILLVTGLSGTTGHAQTQQNQQAGLTTSIVTDNKAPFTQRLHSPGRLAVDSQGTIYTFDTLSRGGFKITPDGEIAQVIDFNLLDEGVGREPDAIAIGSDDSAYFLADRYVVRYRDGEALEIVDYFQDTEIDFIAHTLICDALGRLVFILDSLDRQGTDAARLNTDGSIELLNFIEASVPINLLVSAVEPDSQGGFYIAAGDSVYHQDMNGAIGLAFGPGDHSDTPNENPTTLTLDNSGNLYIGLDTRIYRRTPEIEVSLFRKVSNIVDMGVDQTNRLHVISRRIVALIGSLLNHGINVYSDNDFQGEFTTYAPLMTTDKIDQITAKEGYFANAQDGRLLFSFGRFGIGQFDNGQLTQVTDVLPQPDGGAFGSIALDFLGNAYYSTGSTSTVTRVTPGGVKTELIAGYGDITNELSNADALTVDLAGNTYVAGSQSNNVFRISPQGKIDLLIDATGDGSNALEQPESLAVDSASGTLYVAGRASHNVFRIKADGMIELVLGPEGDGENSLLEPADLALNLKGDLLVAGYGSDNVFRVTAQGSSQILGPSGNGAALLESPISVTSAADGSTYVVGEASNNLFRIKPDGQTDVLLDSDGDGSNSLMQPQQVVTDHWGNVFVTASASHNAFVIGASGEPVMFFDVHDYTEDDLEFARISGIAIGPRGTLLLQTYDGKPIGSPDVYRIEYPEQIAAAYNPRTGELVATIDSSLDGRIDAVFSLEPDSAAAPIFSYSSFRVTDSSLSAIGEFDANTGTLTIPQLHVVGDRVYSDAVLQRIGSTLQFKLVQLNN
ncbi:MAG: NHL repeat-containing protein [Gammaproteobacteria bacterium]